MHTPHRTYILECGDGPQTDLTIVLVDGKLRELKEVQ